MKKGKITIDRERCKGCYLCVRACPMHLITRSSTANASGTYPAQFVDKTRSAEAACIACGSCYTVCPDTAIEVYEYEGGDR